jgi:hypothetical protein
VVSIVPLGGVAAVGTIGALGLILDNKVLFERALLFAIASERKKQLLMTRIKAVTVRQIDVEVGMRIWFSPWLETQRWVGGNGGDALIRS